MRLGPHALISLGLEMLILERCSALVGHAVLL